MHRILLTTLLFLAIAVAFAQAPTSKWQTGTITEVKQVATQQGVDKDLSRYEVSIKVGDTVYVVAYTTRESNETIKYRAGLDLNVLVNKDTMTFNDVAGRKNEVPILRRETYKKNAKD